jgi:hypothetical protein
MSYAYQDWNVTNEARLPRIRLRVYRYRRVLALLGYLVTDGDGVVWAIPETTENSKQAATVAYRLNLAQIDKSPVIGRAEQVIAYRGVLYAPEGTNSSAASELAYTASNDQPRNATHEKRYIRAHWLHEPRQAPLFAMGACFGWRDHPQSGAPVSD